MACNSSKLLRQCSASAIKAGGTSKTIIFDYPNEAIGLIQTGTTGVEHFSVSGDSAWLPGVIHIVQTTLNSQQGIASTGTFNTSAGGNGTYFQTPVLSVMVDSRNITTQNWVEGMQSAKFVAVVKDYSGNYVMYGYNSGFIMTQDNEGTGKVAGDLNGYDLTFTAEVEGGGKILSPALVASLEGLLD